MIYYYCLFVFFTLLSFIWLYVDEYTYKNEWFVLKVISYNALIFLVIPALCMVFNKYILS